MKKKCSVIFGRTLLMMFLCGCMDIFADVVTAWNFSTIVGNMVFEGDNTERSESAVASSYYYYYKLGSTTTLRAYSNSQAWGIVLNKGEAVNVEFDITTGGSYGLNVYCVPLSGNQIRQSLPDGNVTAANIKKCATGSNIGSTQSFAFEVKCTSEYEGNKSYKVTKNGNQVASFSVDGGQFFLVSFLNGAGTQNHDYKLSYTITVKKVTPTPSAPDMVFASQGSYSDRITVAWGYLSDGNSARSYEVYRSTTKSGSKTYLGETQELSYDDRTAAYGTTYYYWIKGKNGSKTSGYSTWEADGWLGEPDYITVSFKANGGTGSMSSQTFAQGVSQKLSANAFTRSGYEFIGWATSSGGSVVYSDQQSISLSANKTLYAVWKVIDGAFDLRFGTPSSRSWKQGFFLNNTSNDVSVMHSFLLGETIYRNFCFVNRGNEILKDEFYVLHEVLNSDGTVRHSYTQFSNYEYAQNYGYYWSNNRWESGLGNLPVGSYIYRCTIDYENVIPESNESNNVFEYSFSIIDASQEDLLLEALGIEKFAVTVGGDAKWFAQKDVTYDGVSAVQSGGISDGQTSWMEVVVKDVSSVSFWCKVSSESGWDKLHFYVDGIEVVDPISGQTDWIKVEYPLTTDSHTLKWVYTKDGSVSNGDDCGWVDKVVLTPAPSTDITVDVGGGNNVNVPVEWINSYADIVAAAGGDKTAALQRTAANGRKVWECYVLGLDPTDPLDDFRITRFWMENGVPKFEFNHATDGSGNSFLSYVKPLGKAQLSDKWRHVPEGGNSSFRFFTVEVVPPGCESSVVDEEDLGGVQLWENGPYWAECNVGATKPEEYGYYFCWGDTVGYTNTGSGWISVKDGTSISFNDSGIASLTYGKDNAALLSTGYIDSTGNLAPAHDAATVHLGSPWRMPTKDEISSLVSKCTTTWTTRNGVYGRLFTGKGAYADKSIFLPAAGYGHDSYLDEAGSDGFYWSSMPHSNYSLYAWGLYFGLGDFYEIDYQRYSGRSVRPVREFAK